MRMKILLTLALAASFVIFFSSGIGKTYGGREDVLERMYSEVVDRSSSLKQLEKELEQNEEQHAELRTRIETYHQISKLYYAAAEQKIKGIGDSSLSKRMRSLVVQSDHSYRQRTAELNRIQVLLQEKSITIQEYHLALKILTTLPEIEKYQKEKLPSVQEFEALLNKMEDSRQKLGTRIK